MLTKRIIACLDVRDGRVVKGVQFVDIVDAGDPAELAHRHAAAGADEIVLLDITATHEGRGTLHRAFSLLIFNDRGELLLQQRAPAKRLWPLYWSNSCCSHPRRGEAMEAAIKRRLYEELGLSCPLHFLFKFQYQAQFGESGAEHELCSVFIARCTDEVRINRDEILGCRWIAPEELEVEISRGGAAKFTPWFMLEWSRIWQEHRAAVIGLQPKTMHS